MSRLTHQGSPKLETNINAIIRVTYFLGRPGSRPRAPVAEEGGLRAATGRPELVTLLTAFTLDPEKIDVKGNTHEIECDRVDVKYPCDSWMFF